MSKICLNCGCKVKDGDLFCAECGAKQTISNEGQNSIKQNEPVRAETVVCPPTPAKSKKKRVGMRVACFVLGALVIALLAVLFLKGNKPDAETRFWKATEILESVVYNCKGVRTVRVIVDDANLKRIGTGEFSGAPVDLSINGLWISTSGREEFGYSCYIEPTEACIFISFGPKEAPSLSAWVYDWKGNLISGNGTLEEYILQEKLVN